MRTYDISLSISPEMPTWPGDPRISVERIQKIEEGADANVTQISMSVHTGTHVDAPYHFLGGNASTIEQLPIKQLTGRAYVLHLPDNVDLITAEVIERAEIPTRTRRLLFRTRNSTLWSHDEKGFFEGFVAISANGAQYLVDHGIKLVGVDYLSVAPYNDGAPTHKILLKAGIIIVEGLNLAEISQGRYTLYCLPLKIDGADGSPARAILIGV